MNIRTTMAGILVFAACIAGYAGQGDPTSAPDTSKAQPASEKTKSAAPPAAGAMVFIDPVTRQIRQPTEAEMAALSAASPAKTATPPETTETLIKGPGGAVGLKLGDETLSYVVATRKPDGKLVITEEAAAPKPAATKQPEKH